MNENETFFKIYKEYSKNKIVSKNNSIMIKSLKKIIISILVLKILEIMKK